MRFLKRKDEPRMMTCPSCSQLVSAEATECDLCGANLTEIPDDQRRGFSANDLVAGSNPYSR
jgi:hypothetical protein